MKKNGEIFIFIMLLCVVSFQNALGFTIIAMDFMAELRLVEVVESVIQIKRSESQVHTKHFRKKKQKILKLQNRITDCNSNFHLKNEQRNEKEKKKRRKK